MKETSQPLAEVFGHLVSDQSNKANRYRSHRLCPFNNKVPNCTKDKAKNPLGVCSVLHENKAVITCPIRFREDWLITDDAAAFFFGEDISWSSLTEVRLNDSHGKSAGNIDVVLCAKRHIRQHRSMWLLSPKEVLFATLVERHGLYQPLETGCGRRTRSQRF